MLFRSVPAGALPITRGPLSLAGEAGTVAVSSGASGAVVSTSKPRVATAWFVAASVARTRKVWGPSASGAAGVWELESEQGPKEGVPVSIEHSKEAPGSELKPKVGDGSLVRSIGPESIWTTGGIVSTVQSKEAGLASTLPALSIALTSNSWAPSVSAVYSRGEVQAPQAPPSRRHWKEAMPDPPSFPEKLKLADALPVSAAGWRAIEIGRAHV